MVTKLIVFMDRSFCLPRNTQKTGERPWFPPGKKQKATEWSPFKLDILSQEFRAANCQNLKSPQVVLTSQFIKNYL